MTDNESADTGMNERFCALPLFLFIDSRALQRNRKTRARTRERLFAFLGRHRR